MSPVSLLTNPWALLAIGATLVGSHVAVGWKAYDLGKDSVYAESFKLAEVEKRTRDAATAAAATEISKIEVRNVTIRQKAETVVREVPVYRDCRHDANGMRAVTDAFVPPGQDLPASPVVVPRDPEPSGR